MKKLILILMGLSAQFTHAYDGRDYVMSPGVDPRFGWTTVSSAHKMAVEWWQLKRNYVEQQVDLDRLLGTKISKTDKNANLQMAQDLHEAQAFDCNQTTTKQSEEQPNIVKNYGRTYFCEHKDDLLTETGIQLFATALKLPTATIKSMLDKNVLQAVQNFGQVARQYDPQISDADVFQASRNVWTAACLQKLLDVKIELNSAIFGYSMLYPYTDNVIDNPALDGKGKKDFLKKFGKMLLNQPVTGLNVEAKKVYDMVQKMYQQYPPSQFPIVQQAILSIYYAQIASMEQRSPKVSGADVLFISAFKGSTSVLADAFLAKPDLNPDEIQMALSFGFLLQLIDDLQDMDADMKIHSQTVFLTPYKSKEVVGNDVLKMLDFSQNAMKSYLEKNPKHALLAQTIYGFLRLLTFEAIAKQQHHFDSDFIDAIEERAPAPLDEFKNIQVEQQIYNLIQNTNLDQI